MEGVLETLGVTSLNWRGRTWQLPRPDFASEGSIRNHLQEEERRWIGVHRKTMTVAEYKEHLDGWRDNCTTGKWAFLSVAWQRAMNDPENFAEMVRLCLAQISGQEFTAREEVSLMIKDKAQEAENLRMEVYWKMMKENVDPTDAILKIQSELVEKFWGLLNPTPSIPPQAAGEASGSTSPRP